MTTRTLVRMPRTQEQKDLDGVVDPIPVNDDADLLDDATILPTDDQELACSYELVSVTSSFEINEVD